MTNATKETTAQRVERLKRAMNPMGRAGSESAASLARDLSPSRPNGSEPISAGGACTPRETARESPAAQNGVGRALQRFMVRIRIPNGIDDFPPTSRHRRPHPPPRQRNRRSYRSPEYSIALGHHRIAARSARRTVAGWTEHNWRMRRCRAQRDRMPGRRRGCGRNRRCLAAGHEASQLLAGNAEFYNLPRKFKISITGCRVWCPYPEINDIGLTRDHPHGRREAGSGILPSRCRRAFDRTLPRRAVERVCPLEPGRARHQGHCGTFPRFRRFARTSRTCPAEISFLASRMDCGPFPR